MKKIISISFFCFVFVYAHAQKNNYWSRNTVNKSGIVTDKGVARISFPSLFALFELNAEPLRQELFSVVDNARRHTTVIELPNADGVIESFEVVEASNFEPALQARFPEIRAFSGRGITDKSATLKLSLSPQGIQTMVFRAGRESEFIEPYSQDHTIYAVFRSQRNRGNLPWTCSTPDADLALGIDEEVQRTGTMARSGGNLKTMRLAQSCNAEYSNYFGATSAAQAGLVLAAFNATLTRCNGVYEKDLALHLNLIANTTDVIFYNPSTDPYTTLNSWNAQLQSTLTSFIGEANYDIGHMFGASGGGGNAGCIGCVCVNGQKGSGITSPADGIPQGDNFDIDYVVHEVGHQLGANHTFSHSLESSGTNKEIGSGITIMGYAGITSYDVANHSIDIYHEASIAQIQANLLTKTCPVTTTIGNSTPVVAALNNYTIPISTPFALTGSATDADPGDLLTYCWEQNDNSTVSGGSSIASVGKASGPNWISFSPTTSPTRYFPKLSTILAGAVVSGPLPGGDAGVNTEALSSISRTLNFRLTVRDNAVYSSTAPVSVGQTQFRDMVVTVTNTSGPFQVTSPNTTVSWQGGTIKNITWNVAGTTGAPVSCANVKILLSTDGGLTFPTVLIPSTPNDGTEALSIPNIPTTTARIKIESVGNIFFDISNSNFTITAAAPGFDFDSPAEATISCNGPGSAAITLGTFSYSGYVTPVNLSASGLPPGTSISFGTNPVTPGNSSVITLNNVNTLPSGTYYISITGVSGALTKTRVLTYTVQTGTGPSIGTQPGNQTVCSGQNASFTVSVSGSVSGYQWQLSTDGGANFTNISGATGSSYTVTGAGTAQNNYQYRVLVTGQCNVTTSDAAILSVASAPVVQITPSSTSICQGQITTLTGSSYYATSASLGVGTSTTDGSTTGVTLGPNPFQNFYGGNKIQMLFRSSELTPIGMNDNAAITAIKFNLVTADPNVVLQNLVVKMKNSNSTALSSAWETGMTTVRNAGNYTVSAGVNTITLTTPFVWDNSSNLVIEINYSNNNTGTTAGIYNTAIYSATSFVSTRWYRADNVSAATMDAFSGAPTSTYSQRNDIGFSFNNPATITWSPVSGLFDDAGAGNAYTGAPADIVYASPSLPGVYNYTASSTVEGCNGSATVGITVHALPLVSFSGLSETICSNSNPVNLVGTPAGGIFSGTGVSGNIFDPAAAGVGGPYTVTYTYTNGNGCTQLVNQQVTVQSCSNMITVNLRLFLQGYYTGAGTMQPVLLNQAVSSSSSEVDNVTIELHDASNFTLVNSIDAMLSVNGTVSATFTQSPGSYYVAVKHRNSIQTWSANPIACSAATPLYDFTSAANKAYGDNMVEVESGIWAFFTGDINQDENIDIADYPDLDNDVNNFSFGFYATDLNGDGNVDIADYPVLDANIQGFIYSVHP
jgi:hypothetical protein